MNRRNFLKKLAVVPVAMVVPALPAVKRWVGVDMAKCRSASGLSLVAHPKAIWSQKLLNKYYESVVLGNSIS